MQNWINNCAVHEQVNTILHLDFYNCLKAIWSCNLEIYMITHFYAAVQAMFANVVFQPCHHAFELVSCFPLSYILIACKATVLIPFYIALAGTWHFKLEICMITHFCATVRAMLADVCFQSCHYVLNWFHVSHCPIN